ncbi:cadmium-translocating P-type ATPase [Erysipelotrichaceae bacterium Oil+RF-744-GAM-WT-6]|uniref:Cd(2+)-exporting ATPase n=1 Tax=Stecheria intestinalis TaxID=2606630 RepID=A0A7X2NRI4_9FIRM|nr:heavy metal translocating P-type ATPase [Stecheria intestinalis]MSS58242.1 cadmium-translocating P-type ATPase [Stecheria intestinalis]
MSEYRLKLEGLDCAACAAKLEGQIQKIEGVNHAQVDFMTLTCTYDCDSEKKKEVEQKIREVIKEEEPDVVVSVIPDARHTHQVKLHLEGLDCADCAAKLEGKLAGIPGISNVQVSFLNLSAVYECEASEDAEIEKEVRRIIAEEEPEVQVSRIAAGKKVVSRFHLEGLDCADCAAKLERKIAEIPGIEHVQVDFMTLSASYECAPKDDQRIEAEMRRIIAEMEPEVIVTRLEKLAGMPAEEAEEDEDSETVLKQIIIGAVLLLIGVFFQGTVRNVLFLASYVVLGYQILIRAVKNIGRGQLFDENFLMAVATVAAIFLGDYAEAAGVMLFYQIGEYFQDRAVAKSKKSIGDLMNIRPDYAVVSRNGAFIQVSPEEVEIGEIVRVKPGEKIPLDGVIVKGSSSLNTASLTGESKPRDVEPGDEVISGSVNETGLLEIRVTKEFGESTVAKILDLVQNSQTKRAKAENFITKFSRVYTPIVVFSAIAVAVMVGIFTRNWSEGIYRACTFLVISCPCALVISIPLSFFAGIGGLSSRGVLVKGANLIETLAKTEQVVMDKTGTLTSGTFAAEEVLTDQDQNRVLEDAAYAECYSNHPIAEGIRKSYGKKIEESRISEVQEIPGRGVRMKLDGAQILAGNARLMQEENIPFTECSMPGSLVYVARDGAYEGCIVLRDQLKPDAKKAIAGLKKAGIRTAIVSGDSMEVTSMVQDQLGADMAFGECLPDQKVAKLEELKKGYVTAFVGDGVNDAPVLTVADIGIAMGALGSDAAIEAADVVIMDDQPSKIVLAIDGAKRVLRVANENIYGAITIKILTLVLGALGIANMWWAIFADTGVAMLCVLNSMRLLKIAEKK